MPRAYASPPPSATKWFPGNIVCYCATESRIRSATKITVHNSTTDGRIVPLDRTGKNFLEYKDTARLPAEQPMYEGDQKATDWLFLVFTSSAARQITWKSSYESTS